MTSFSDLALNDSIVKALDKLGFETPTGIQEKVIPKALTNKDMVVCSQTGSGKTIAFAVPLLQRILLVSKPNSGVRALILVPTRELALQIQKSLQSLSAFTWVKTGLVIGGEAFKYQVASLRRNPEILVATPGRLVEHLEKRNIDFNDLETLVLDEADRMLDMGFAEDMHKIISACHEQRQMLLFSATLKHRAMGRLRDQLKEPELIGINEAQGWNDQIQQCRILVDDDAHKLRLCSALITQKNPERVFIFCNKRIDVQKVSNLLRANKLRADYIHGEVSQSARKQVLARFRDGKVHILVATDVAARGLDVDDVELVINFDVAQSGDDHVHRVGRTGRADKTGVAITLVSASEWNRASSIERYLKFRFETTKVVGLEAKYTGPKKVKKSGKAVGPKKKNTKRSTNAAKKKSNTPRRQPLGDGSAPLRRSPR